MSCTRALGLYVTDTKPLLNLKIIVLLNHTKVPHLNHQSVFLVIKAQLNVTKQNITVTNLSVDTYNLKTNKSAAFFN